MLQIKNDYDGNGNRFSVFVSNFNSQQLPIQSYTVDIYINNDNGKCNGINGYRIDANNTNPVETWKEMGSPEYPSEAQ